MDSIKMDRQLSDTPNRKFEYSIGDIKLTFSLTGSDSARTFLAILNAAVDDVKEFITHIEPVK